MSKAPLITCLILGTLAVIIGAFLLTRASHIRSLERNLQTEGVHVLADVVWRGSNGNGVFRKRRYSGYPHRDFDLAVAYSARGWHYQSRFPVYDYVYESQPVGSQAEIIYSQSDPTVALLVADPGWSGSYGLDEGGFLTVLGGIGLGVFSYGMYLRQLRGYE